MFALLPAKLLPPLSPPVSVILGLPRIDWLPPDTLMPASLLSLAALAATVPPFITTAPPPVKLMVWEVGLEPLFWKLAEFCPPAPEPPWSLSAPPAVNESDCAAPLLLICAQLWVPTVPPPPVRLTVPPLLTVIAWLPAVPVCWIAAPPPLAEPPVTVMPPAPVVMFWAPEPLICALLLAPPPRTEIPPARSEEHTS